MSYSRFELERSFDGHPIRDNETSMLYAQCDKKELVKLLNSLSEKAERATPIENGRNRYGVDVSYFRKTINRELNRSLTDFTPSELARVFARLSQTADPKVMHEPEFKAEEHLTQWIAVSEKKPEIGVNVITGVLVNGVMTDEDVDQWYKCPEYGDEAWLHRDEYPCGDGRPTHWCKIPEFKREPIDE